MGKLKVAYSKAVKANDELKDDRYASLVAAGQTLVDQIDEAVESGDADRIKAAVYLMPYLVSILKEQYATPASRAAAGLTKGGSSGGALAKFQSIQGGKSTGA